MTKFKQEYLESLCESKRSSEKREYNMLKWLREKAVSGEIVLKYNNLNKQVRDNYKDMYGRGVDSALVDIALQLKAYIIAEYGQGELVKMGFELDALTIKHNKRRMVRQALRNLKILKPNNINKHEIRELQRVRIK